MSATGTAGQTTTRVSLAVDGPFSLAAAAAFGFGPRTGRPVIDEAVMRLAFVTDDLQHQAGAVIRQELSGDLIVDISTAGGTGQAAQQVRRVLSVDRPAAGWLAAGQADPVLGSLQARHPGLRPVLFHSPYEAAAWGIISQRRPRAQATALRQRLSAELGQAFDLAGETEYAFPLPDRLLELDTFPGLEPARADRLRAIAEHALAGHLDRGRLAALETETAMAQLLALPGIGPFYAGLILLRATGASDALTLDEPRLPAYLRHYYDLTELPGRETVQRLAEPWRPFRTWAVVLIRVAGDADGLPWKGAAVPGEGRPRRRAQNRDQGELG